MLFPNNVIIMFKKQFTLIFLATAFLSFDNKTQAMTEPTTSKTIKLQNTLHSNYCWQEPCNTLKFLAASALIKTLENQGIDLNDLNPENKNHRKILGTMPAESIEYCQKCQIISDLINQHINTLEQFKAYEHLKINEKILYRYNKLLYKLFCDNIDMHYIGIEKILSRIYDKFASNINIHPHNHITLEDINVLLQLSMQPLIIKEDINLSKQKATCLDKIWNFIDTDLYAYNALLNLIIKNNPKLLPPLNHIVKDQFNNTENFLMFLVKHNIDITFLKSIIDEEKNKDYNWEQFFSMRTEPYNYTILHCAADDWGNIYKGTFKIILNLMKEKKLKLDNFINTQDDDGHTPLILATISGRDEIIELLIKHGADINIPDAEGQTALDYVYGYRDWVLARINSNPNDNVLGKKRCIELLESATNNSINK